jgi:stage V sporulation protein SpoVS
VQTVSLTDKTSGAAIYYTTNGATPTASSTKYTGAIKVAASETIKAIAVASGYTNSAVASATYTISQPVTASPSFSPAGGTYSSVQTVSLTDKTSGAAIYYTTNGATPTTSSTKYTGAIKVAASETIKAIAVASGYTNSAVVSATYTINLSTLSAHGFSVAVSPASLTVSGGQSGTATTTVTPQSGFTSTVSFIC